MIKQIIGGLLIASPFVGVTILIVRAYNWRMALFSWGVTLVVMGLVAVGVVLVV